MKNYFNTFTSELSYYGYTINYSKNYKNKISLFNEDNFISDFENIMLCKLYIKKYLLK